MLRITCRVLNNWRGNCNDNPVAESFSSLVARERIRRKTYRTREEAKRGLFDYIQVFKIPKRKHIGNGMLLPIAYEWQQETRTQGV